MPHPTPAGAPLWRLRARSQLMQQMRAFFAARDFVEVDTPVLLRAPAPELHIEAVPVAICMDGFGQGAPSPRFLQTSPELAMKRLVAAGLPRIYQVAPVFRDGDGSPVHCPEFRMLEWYRAHAPLDALMADCTALLAQLAACAEALEAELNPGGAQNEAGRAAILLARAQRAALRAPCTRIGVDAAFRAHAGFSILEHDGRDALEAAMRAQGLRTAPDDSWLDLYDRAFVERVEPALQAHAGPLFLTDFPAPLAALARLSPEDPRVAERFELYAGGVELANAFAELTCPAEQRRRFVAERAARAALGRRDYPLDEIFLASLTQMPPTCGIALGLDRLLMLLLGGRSLDDVAAIPFSTG